MGPGEVKAPKPPPNPRSVIFCLGNQQLPLETWFFGSVGHIRRSNTLKTSTFRHLNAHDPLDCLLCGKFLRESRISKTMPRLSTIVLSSSAWIVQMRWSNFASSVRSVVPEICATKFHFKVETARTSALASARWLLIVGAATSLAV